MLVDKFINSVGKQKTGYLLRGNPVLYRDLAIDCFGRNTRSAYTVAQGPCVRNLLVKQLEIFKRVTLFTTHMYLVIN